MSVVQRAALGAIRLYQLAISGLIGPCCRFHPSCSEYCAGAIREHGMARGAWMGVRRLLKCHPFHPGGFDPVPPRAVGGKAM